MSLSRALRDMPCKRHESIICQVVVRPLCPLWPGGGGSHLTLPQDLLLGDTCCYDLATPLPEYPAPPHPTNMRSLLLCRSCCVSVCYAVQCLCRCCESVHGVAPVVPPPSSASKEHLEKVSPAVLIN